MASDAIRRAWSSQMGERVDKVTAGLLALRDAERGWTRSVTMHSMNFSKLHILLHPGQMNLLREDPSLVKSAIEELLGYESPLETATKRYAREDPWDTRSLAAPWCLRSSHPPTGMNTKFDRPDTVDVIRTEN